MSVHTFAAALLLSIGISAPNTAGQYSRSEQVTGLSPVPTLAQGHLQGAIQGDKGAITSAMIQVQGLSGASNFRTFSDEHGRFALTLPRGTYLITASSGTETVTEQVVVDNDATVNLRLRGNDNPVPSENQGSISVAQMKVPDKAQRALQKAREALAKGKLDDAFRSVEKAITLYPQFAAALSFRGILERNDQPEQALADAEKAVEYDPNYSIGYVALGSTYTRLGRYDDAVRSLDRALVLSPSIWQGYFEMSRALIGKRDFIAAMRNIRGRLTWPPRSTHFSTLHGPTSSSA